MGERGSLSGPLQLGLEQPPKMKAQPAKAQWLYLDVGSCMGPVSLSPCPVPTCARSWQAWQGDGVGWRHRQEARRCRWPLPDGAEAGRQQRNIFFFPLLLNKVNYLFMHKTQVIVC